uniref:Uncharacterized protein n=1 Tax=Sphaerodactylus townsendi TaxID=933632 RepID=A0ACB8E6R6_9SAUR
MEPRKRSSSKGTARGEWLRSSIPDVKVWQRSDRHMIDNRKAERQWQSVVLFLWEVKWKCSLGTNRGPKK